jgi:hypothetical protein
MAVVAVAGEVVEQLRLPGPLELVIVLVVHVEGGDEDPLSELPERGLLAQDPLEHPAHRRDLVVRTTELAEVQQIIEPRIIEDLRAVVHIEITDLVEVEPARNAERQQTAGGGPGDEVDVLEKAFQPRGGLQTLHHHCRYDPANATAINRQNAVLGHRTPPVIGDSFS